MGGDARAHARNLFNFHTFGCHFMPDYLSASSGSSVGSHINTHTAAHIWQMLRNPYFATGADGHFHGNDNLKMTRKTSLFQRFPPY